MAFCLVYVMLLFLFSVTGQQPEVTTKEGTIAGISTDTGLAFLGVPYAEPPTGKLRFKKPMRKTPWTGVLNATEYGAACMQDRRFIRPDLPKSEDCLFLNVYVPGDIDKNNTKAVMVWVHGGGFMLGYGHQLKPAGLSRQGDVIVVTINYRLGVFGFLSTEDDSARGNYGLWDQHLAFRWVKENIAQFGGDEYRVTIFGESSGAASVGIHALSQKNRGLFHRVIAQSGTVIARWFLQREPLAKAKRFGKLLNCSTTMTTELVACLRSRNAVDISILDTFPEASVNHTGPVVDGELILLPPREIFMKGNSTETSRSALEFFSELDFLSGFNQAEGGAYLPLIAQLQSKYNFNISQGIPTFDVFKHFLEENFPRNIEIISAAVKQEYFGHSIDQLDPVSSAKATIQGLGEYDMEANAVEIANQHAALTGSGRTYLYRFSRRLPIPSPTINAVMTIPSWFEGVSHADELLYLFDITLQDTGFQEYANYTRLLWTHFAKSGHPKLFNNDSSVWPEYIKGEEKYLEIGHDEITAKSKFKPDRMQFWNGFIKSVNFLPEKISCAKDTDLKEESEDMQPVVDTMFGKIRGKRVVQGDKLWDIFYGIPYAEPPIGENRFKPPSPASVWSGIKNATDFKPRCIATTSVYQLPERFSEYKQFFEESEDCLYLNIFKPSGLTKLNNEKLAVMVYIHGGGLTEGSANDFDSRGLSWYGRVIVVNINHRLGVFGFLSTGDYVARGNFGLLDQNLALRWVKNNIISFGGDPDRITVFGQSAGGTSVTLHILSPRSKGLFNRAIIHSGVQGAIDWTPGSDSLDSVRILASRVNCTTSATDDMVNCLREIEVDVLKNLSTGLSFFPVLDGDFITGRASVLFEQMISGNHQESPVQVMLGSNSMEGLGIAVTTYALPILKKSGLSDGISYSEFQQFVRMSLQVLSSGNTLEAIFNAVINEYTNWSNTSDRVMNMKQFIEVISDLYFDAPSVYKADALSSTTTVYLYYYGYVPSEENFLLKILHPDVELPSWVGADHVDELNFVHGSVLTEGLDMPQFNYTEDDQEVSLMMVNYWSNFARFGNPNSFDTPKSWPTYDKKDRKYLYLDKTPSVRHDLKPKKSRFMNTVLKYIAETTPVPCKSQMGTPMPGSGDSTKTSWEDESENITYTQKQTKSGPVLGYTLQLSFGKEYFVFYGIPYAKPPTGSRRFKPPEKLEPWSVPVGGDKAPSCPQVPTLLMKMFGFTNISEDCLYLNIFGLVQNRSDTAKRPVFFYIHDGFFTQGTGSIIDMVPPIEPFRGIIGVSFNYRLGALGFASSGDSTIAGNMGILDMVAALDWVRDNIAVFGGDPEQITIAGVGAGGVAVNIMLQSPLTKNKFKRAVSIDAHYFSPLVYTKARLVSTSRSQAALVGCNEISSDDILKCLQGKTTEELIVEPTIDQRFYPIVDNVVLSMDVPTGLQQGNFMDVDLMLGSTQDYSGLFLSRFIPYGNLTEKMLEEYVKNTLRGMTVENDVLKHLTKISMLEYTNAYDPTTDHARNFQTLTSFVNDRHFYNFILNHAELHNKNGGKTYIYNFRHRPSYSISPDFVGATLTDDVGLLMGLPYNPLAMDTLEMNVTDQEKLMSWSMINFLVNFVQSGNPNNGSTVPTEWPAYAVESQKFLIFDTTMTPSSAKNDRAFHFWRKYFPFALSYLESFRTTVPEPPITTPFICSPGLETSDFFKSLNMTSIENLEELTLALIIIIAVLGVLFIGTAIYAYVKVSKSKKASRNLYVADVQENAPAE